MRIAQVAPLSARIPPRAYGGTERVIHLPWLVTQRLLAPLLTTLHGRLDLPELRPPALDATGDR